MTRSVRFGCFAVSLIVVTLTMSLAPLMQGTPAAAEAEDRVVSITINGPRAVAAAQRGQDSAKPTAAATAADVWFSAGYHQTCALTERGGLKCWGRNDYGQVGDGTEANRFLPVNVHGLGSGVIASAAGGFHTCALTQAGGVKCWGGNFHGQVGDGTTTERHTPVNVSGLSSGVVAITADAYHNCALTTAGGVKCWGWNSYGHLGDGTTTTRPTPVDVSGLSSGVAAIAAGSRHTCALTTAGGVKCWGWNYYGQIGDGSGLDQHTPVFVRGLTSGVTAITTGWAHTCALTAAGGVLCWGRNEYGQIGDGTKTVRRALPTNVRGLENGITAVSAAGQHTCALPAAGRVLCWGWNWAGQLGDGTTKDRLIPVHTQINATRIEAGNEHTCAMSENGRLKCWGNNYSGQLGDGTGANSSLPVPVWRSRKWHEAAPG